MTTLKSDGISAVLEPTGAAAGAAACWMTGGW